MRSHIFIYVSLVAWVFCSHTDDFSSCPDVCTEVTPEVLFMRLQIWLLKA